MIVQYCVLDVETQRVRADDMLQIYHESHFNFRIDWQEDQYSLLANFAPK